MKITVDTKEDSQEEIKKAISLLNTFVEEKEVITNLNIETKPQQDNVDVGKILNELNKEDDEKKEIKDLKSNIVVEY